MKLLKKKKYFQCRDNSFYTEFTKKEIADMIDPFDFNTIRPFLKKMDYGAWETEYNRYVDFAIHSGQNPKIAIYKFISFMRLAVPRQWGYDEWEEFIRDPNRL